MKLPHDEEVSMMYQCARDDEDLAERAYAMGVKHMRAEAAKLARVWEQEDLAKAIEGEVE